VDRSRNPLVLSEGRRVRSCGVNSCGGAEVGAPARGPERWERQGLDMALPDCFLSSKSPVRRGATVLD
jgi:hypothetical protein